VPGKECENLDEQVVGDDPIYAERNGGRRKKSQYRCRSHDDRVENDETGQKRNAWGHRGRIAHFYQSPPVGLLSAMMCVPPGKTLLAFLNLRNRNVSRL